MNKKLLKKTNKDIVDDNSLDKSLLNQSGDS